MAEKVSHGTTPARPIGKQAPALRTFRIPALAQETGCAVFEVGGRIIYSVEVDQGDAVLTTTVGGPVRVVTAVDSKETLDGLIEGRIHPIVAGLQNLLTARSGERRFALHVLLALRASAPAFARGGA